MTVQHCLARIVPLHRGTDERREIHVASANLREITGLNGEVWEPAMVQGPTLNISLFNGNFDEPVSPGSAGLPLQIGVLNHTYPWADECAWIGAAVDIWAGAAGEAWPWTLVFTGKVSGFERKHQVLTLTAEVDFEDKDVLTATYAGTGGAEGSADLKGQVKPLVLGWAKNVEPVLIDAVNNVYQFSGYGPIEQVVDLYERGSAFEPTVGDFADYDALVLGTVPPGRWATCLAEGLIRLGAPQYGVITGDVKGHKVGAETPRLTGEIITALADMAGIDPARIVDATLTALDDAVPFPINLVMKEQEKFGDLARRLALPCNHQAGVSLLGQFFVLPITLAGTPALTIDAEGRSLPQVIDSGERDVSPPYWRTVMGANRAWRVHTDDEIASTGANEPDATRNQPAQLLQDADFSDDWWLLTGGTQAVWSDLSPIRWAAAIPFETGEAAWAIYGGFRVERFQVQAGKAIWVRVRAHSAGSIYAQIYEDGVPIVEDGQPVVDSGDVEPADWPLSVAVEWYDAAGTVLTRTNLPDIAPTGAAIDFISDPLTPPAGAAMATVEFGHGALSVGTGVWVVWSPWVDEHQPAADVTSQAQVTVEMVADKVLAADYQGGVLADALAGVQWLPAVARGGAAITLSDMVSYSLTGLYGVLTGTGFVLDNTAGSPSKGTIAIAAGTTLGNTAGGNLVVTVDGTALPPIAFKVTKELAGVPVSGAQKLARWLSGEMTGITSASYVPIFTSTKTLAVASGETLYGTAPINYYLQGTGLATRTMTFKWQYAVAGSGTWNDFAAGITGTLAEQGQSSAYGGEPPVPGYAAVTQSKSGLSAGDYDIRMVALLSAGSLTCLPSGTATMEAKV